MMQVLKRRLLVFARQKLFLSPFRGLGLEDRLFLLRGDLKRISVKVSQDWRSKPDLLQQK